MPYVPITALPTAPERTQSQAVFSSNTDAFLTALPPLVTEINAAGDFIEASEISAGASATSATASEAGALSAANYKGEWSALTGALNIPASASNGGAVYVLKVNLADVTTSEPGVTSDWIVISNNDYDIKSSSFTIIAGERYSIDSSGGAINAAMPASLVIGQLLTVHSQTISSNTVLISNPLFTIRGASGTIPAGTDLELKAGDTAQLVAVTTLILGVV
jgi:hypothetical protein